MRRKSRRFQRDGFDVINNDAIVMTNFMNINSDISTKELYFWNNLNEDCFLNPAAAEGEFTFNNVYTAYISNILKALCGCKNDNQV